MSYRVVRKPKVVVQETEVREKPLSLKEFEENEPDLYKAFSSSPELLLELIYLFENNSMTDEEWNKWLDNIEGKSFKEAMFLFPFQDDHKANMEIELALFGNEEGAADDPTHPCPRDGCIRTISTRAQARGRDEGTSFYLTCTRCGYRWLVG